MTASSPTRVPFSDLASMAGTVLGTSRWRAVDQDAIDRFAVLTGDHQWIHTDPDRAAAEGPFGSTVAHGFLTLALSTAFIAEVAVFEGVGAAVNYGCDQVRFTAPLRSGSRVRGHVTLTSVRRRGRQFTEVGLEVRFEVEGQEALACTAQLVVLLSPETTSDPAGVDAERALAAQRSPAPAASATGAQA